MIGVYSMKLDLIVLGLLMKGNQYGYEMRIKVRECSQGKIIIKPGSIYYFLNMALKNGWIKMIGFEKKRQIYEITPEGKKHYKKELKKYYKKKMVHFSVDVILMFLNFLDENEREHFIKNRIECINDRLLSINEQINEDKENIHLYSYIESHLMAELDWIKSLQ